jgi:hypothetical protein
VIPEAPIYRTAPDLVRAHEEQAKLDLAPDATTPDERPEAVEVLRKALQMLDGCEKAPEDSISGRE